MASVIKKIQAYNRLLRPDLKKMKWAALAESPFRFFRGTDYLFAADLEKEYGFRSKVRAWVCGDLHFENFGSYKGANRLVYFDINDFDEAILATPEVDVARFLSSIIIAGQQMNAGDSAIYKTVKDVAALYTSTLAAGKALVMEGDLAHGVLAQYFKQLATRDRQSFIGKHTEKKKGKLLLKPDGVHFMPVTEEEKQIVHKGLKPLLLQNKHFSHLTFEDIAFRIAGTGSLGLNRYSVLCNDKKKGKNYLIDVKEVRQSCYRSVVNTKQPVFENDADRIIYAQYTMQFNTPDFLTSTRINNKWFVVKELQPMIDKMALPSFRNDFASFTDAAMDMAPLIAYAQLRSSGHKGSSIADELQRFANKKQWQKDIIAVSGELAAKNNLYYKMFLENEMALWAHY